MKVISLLVFAMVIAMVACCTYTGCSKDKAKLAAGGLYPGYLANSPYLGNFGYYSSPQFGTHYW
uniref:Orphan peptide AbOp-22 n=1 Tax=Androctonus bicolor TaxID=748906 RepID=A0A0K0LC28_9SCOR|nr:orphan peptide AbOp-22 [Androctonus bicolor]AIX87728.1 orphan peptide AbOp-22 [Androctonus bicolor]